VAELDLVEQHVAERSDVIGVAHTPAELDALLGEGRIALVHAIEGGFQLGPDESAVRDHVRTLAGRGVGYVTVAHLFWREVATNAPALPFLPDWLYNLVFPQPDRGLSDLGRAAVEAMIDEGILVDITHMSARSIDDTLALFDRRDPDRRIPVLATHMSVRPARIHVHRRDDPARRGARRSARLHPLRALHHQRPAQRELVRGFRGGAVQAHRPDQRADRLV
jgi:microsomal dipeptidase-like Zn-dependent dipeptidase